MSERFIEEGKPGVTQRARRAVLDVVERRPAHDGVLPQQDRHPDRDDRQPDADRHSVRAEHGSSATRTSGGRSRRSRCGTSGSRSSTRSPPTAPFSTTRRATARRVLYRIYQMGKDDIQWGSEDHWTFTPHEMARVQDGLVATGTMTAAAIPGAASTHGRRAWRARRWRRRRWRRRRTRRQSALRGARRRPEQRDPRGFILPSDQPDFGTATRFVNTLIKSGIACIARPRRSRWPARVSGQLVRREDRAGVPAARDGHVRAAGSPGRHPVSRAARRRRRTTRRLHAGVPDGRAVRSHPRRVRRAVRES